MSTQDIIFFLARPIVYHIPLAMTTLLVLFLLSGTLADYLKKKKAEFLGLIMVISLGLYFRLCLAYVFVGNSDLRSWDKIATWALEGQQIYNATGLFGYFPPWISILAFIKKLSLILPHFSLQPPFYFLLRAFLSLVDLLIFVLLILLAKLQKSPWLRIGISFFLNPVIVIISGFHGQFENLALLFILLGIYIYLKNKNFYLAWIAVTFGAIFKHMFLNQILIFLHYIFPKKQIRVLFFSFLSALLAGATLLPFLKIGFKVIKSNILCYYSSKNYGLPFLMDRSGLIGWEVFYRKTFTFLFLLGPFLIKKKSLTNLCLMGTLFFISFTPGISDQYFVLPIAFGALNQGIFFYLYSLFTSLYFLGSPAQFNLPGFKIFSKNIVWFISLFWLLIKYFKNHESKA